MFIRDKTIKNVKNHGSNPIQSSIQVSEHFQLSENNLWPDVIELLAELRHIRSPHPNVHDPALMSMQSVQKIGFYARTMSVARQHELEATLADFAQCLLLLSKPGKPSGLYLEALLLLENLWGSTNHVHFERQIRAIKCFCKHDIFYFTAAE